MKNKLVIFPHPMSLLFHHTALILEKRKLGLKSSNNLIMSNTIRQIRNIDSGLQTTNSGLCSSLLHTLLI